VQGQLPCSCLTKGNYGFDDPNGQILKKYWANEESVRPLADHGKTWLTNLEKGFRWDCWSS
jgi:hypothetical protein